MNYLKSADKLEKLEYIFSHKCKERTLRMAKKPSQGRNKEDIRDLVRKAGLVSYVVELSDLYCDLVLANKLRFSEVAKAYMSCLTEYEMETKAVH